LDSEGTVVGFGKKVKVVNKQATLTTCEVIPGKWVFVGDNKGSLHIYDWKLLSHVKTFSEHQGPVLAIKVDDETKSVYFTGSDSKVGMVRLVNEEWKLGQHIRGQSHDILALERLGGYLVSGGLTTDICFYHLEAGEFNGEYEHKVSYCGSNRVDS
jgi:WD40 repeat protein